MRSNRSSRSVNNCASSGKLSRMYTTLISLLLVVALLATGAIAVCTNNDLRIYGNNPNQGALQICKSNAWYSVCGYSWGCSDAKVACRQMGFTGPVAYYSHCCGYYGTLNPRDNRRWHCSSNHQSTLASCSFSYFSQCSYSSYYYYRPAGIRCNPLSYTAPNCSSNAEGDIRLQSGSNEYEGRLEVCYNGRWSSVCSVDQHDAAVACKQLGHSIYSSVYTTGYGSSQSAITSLTCQSSYNHFNQCTINGYSTCSTSTTLSLPSCSRAIRCTPYPAKACPEGAVRLVDGSIEQEGRVEVCLGGVWGMICRYGWSAVDAYVACKQLGYDPGIAPALLTSQFGSGDGPVVYSYVNCMGFEKSLSLCSKTQYPSVTCPANYFAEVRCYEDCNDGDIRLTGGLTDAEGTVEICRGNLWGLVSEIEWSNSAAQVVCRQLGVNSQNPMAVNSSHYGRPRKSMHYSHVSCTGAEDRLTQCAKTSISLTVGKTTYINEPAAAVSCHGSPTTQPPCVPPSPPPSSPVCQNNPIRLMGGQASNEGRLEYCYNGQWSPFCTLRSQEATVACRQLGYTHYTGAAVITDGQFGSISNYSLFQNITCSSSATETTLGNCVMYEAIDCLPSCPNIGIRCYTPGSCIEGAVRLMDGVIQQEGRIEVCLNGVWGSLCDQAWDKTDAHVLCQELGYAELEPVAYHNSYFGAGNGPILYSNVSCGGWETSFAMCSKNEFLSFSCPREHTAGLLCGERCNDGEIRLVGGSTNLEGTVEICFGNLWGLIAESGWGDHDAAATCRQLGFLGEGAVSFRDSHFGKPNKTIHASGVTCAGDEQTLTDCTLTTYPLEQGKMMASSIDVAGVSCQVYSSCAKVPAFDESNSCINDSIRLSGGAMSTEGRLEYCYQGSWTPLCSVSSKEATVACRQLGYIDNDWASLFTDGRFGTPNNVSYFQNVSCTGNEVQLKDCNLNDSCSSSCASTIGIRCYNIVNDTSSCSAGELRLIGGTVDKNGRVEVCLNGVWGRVCADGWGISDAFVACKQLGMGEGRPTSITNSTMFGEGNGPVVYSNVICHGWESNIVECPKDLYGTFECPNSNVAGVICRDVCSSGDVRLVGGVVESEGTVEICSMSLWGLISATNWADRNAGVVCRELGFQYSGAKAVVDSRFGKPSSFVHLTNVQCSGTEGALANCTASTISQGSSSLVDHINVAGVVCMSAASSTSVSTMANPRPSTVSSTLGGLEMQLPLFIVVGVMAVLLVAGLLVIILLAVIVITNRKTATYGDKDQLIDTAGALPVSNPAFDENYEDMDNVHK